MESSASRPGRLHPASLSPTAVVLATISLVALAAVLPFGAVIGGPLALSIGVWGRREAKAVGAPTTAYDVAVVAGILLVLLGVALAVAVLLLLPVGGGTSTSAPS